MPAVDYFINHGDMKSTENYRLCSLYLCGENSDVAERTRTWETASFENQPRINSDGDLPNRCLKLLEKLWMLA